MLNHLDLFSGIGGFSLGMEATKRIKTVAFCDIDKFCKKVLNKHWPTVPVYNDIKELTYEKLKTDGIGPIDILTCGYPCQPFSNAGLKKGEKDPRHLWPDCFRLIKECRPSVIVGENVSGHIKLGLDSVISDLESQGYGTRTFSVSAASVGAPHKRERVWVLAYSERNHNFNKKQRIDGEEKKIPREHREENSTSRQSSGTSSIRETGSEYVANTESISSDGREDRKYSKERDTKGEVGGVSSNVANTVSGNAQTGCERQGEVRQRHSGKRIPGDASSCSENPWEGWWDLEPKLGRVVNGVPNRVDRLKGLGNSVVSLIPFLIAKSLLEVMDE